jgi:hypothetical protein
LRGFEAEEGQGSVTDAGGGISRGTARPGIGRGSEDTIGLCTSAMAVVVAQKETVLFADPEVEASSSLSLPNRDSRVAHACIRSTACRERGCFSNSAARIVLVRGNLSTPLHFSSSKA